jgi:hypothetical protein
MMKKFLIFIFAFLVSMVGVIALMLSSYYRAYENAHNHSSYSWTKETYPVEKYSNPIDKYNDNFELLFNLLVKKLFSPTLVEKEFKRAYETAKNLSADSPISMQAIKDKIKIYNYSEGANQYAVYKLNIDWKEQAVLAAKSLQKYRYSKEKLAEQLINVELFTQEEADYAVEQVNFDWKENAVKEAESYVRGGKITKEKMLEILVENKKFTQEEAEYAIEHAKIDWSN